MKQSAIHNFKRTWRASWRDTFLLLREFRNPLIYFLIAVLGLGLVYFLLAGLAGEPVASRAESIYLMLTLTFLQPNGPFPKAWYLQLFFFAMPVIGVGILAQGLADFGVLLFNRRARGKEWQMAVASTYNNHIVLIGVGHLGFNVIQELHNLDQDVVALDSSADSDLLRELHRYNIPIIIDDGTKESSLLAAGINKARTVVLCTQNDSRNLQMALKARSLNPGIQVVTRIFDNDFAQSLRCQFGFTAMSATGMAAPIFAAAAAGVDITPPITIEGQAHSLARITIKKRSKLLGQSLNIIEDKFEVSVVLLNRDGKSELHPDGDIEVLPGDVLGIFGNPNRINSLVREN